MAMTDLSRRFHSVAVRGLVHDSLPMRLWQRAKRFGTWDPSEIDLSTDAEQWGDLDPDQRDFLLRLSALFQAGEAVATLHLPPLLMAVAGEGRLEDEIYLASVLFEEAKHVETFRRFLEEVANDGGKVDRYVTPAYRKVFLEILPETLQELGTDPSPVAQARAGVVYSVIVEGVLAETGHHAYDRILDRNDILPGMREAVRLVRRDESRHMAYGIYFLSHLVDGNGPEVWNAVDETMADLMGPAVELINEAFASYEAMPFGLKVTDFTDFAIAQCRRRVGRLRTAREEGVEAALRTLEADELAEDGTGG